MLDQINPGGFAEQWRIVAGQPMFIRTTGEPDSPAIVHVHGFASSGKYMMPTAVALPEFWNVVPDLPGFGRSVDPPRTLSIEELADSLAAMMDELGIARAALLGNSLGTSIICGFAARHPERITAALLVSPAGGRANTPFLRAVGQLARDALREPPALAGVSAPEYMRFGVVEMLRLFGQMTRFPALAHMLELQVPTLAVLGTRDPLLPPWSRIREVASHLRTNVHIAVIRGAAHAINFSHPEPLAELVREFLAGQLTPGFKELHDTETFVLRPHRAGDQGAEDLAEWRPGRHVRPGIVKLLRHEDS